MTYIPNVRDVFTKPLCVGTKGAEGREREENPYWEGNLRSTDREYVRGYDICVEDVECAFANAEDYECGADVRPSDVGKVIGDFKEWLLDWLENSRNETVVSILDGYYAGSKAISEKNTAGLADAATEKQ